MSSVRDVAIIGGGIVGAATGMALARRGTPRVVLLEAEPTLAAHQTGHNSGVIHSGLYYKPGSLKARNSVEGRQALYRFCAEHRIPHERCGKIVVAVDPSELPALEELERRGRANGLEGLRRLRGAELKDYEPAVEGIAGLLVPDTGIVDYGAVTKAYAGLVTAAGGEVRTATRVLRVPAPIGSPRPGDDERSGRDADADQLRGSPVGPRGAPVRRRPWRHDRSVSRGVPTSSSPSGVPWSGI